MLRLTEERLLGLEANNTHCEPDIQDVVDLIHDCRQARKFMEALKEIAAPITYARIRAEAEGKVLDGHWAVWLSNDANHLKDIAERALKCES